MTVWLENDQINTGVVLPRKRVSTLGFWGVWLCRRIYRKVFLQYCKYSLLVLINNLQENEKMSGIRKPGVVKFFARTCMIPALGKCTQITHEKRDILFYIQLSTSKKQTNLDVTTWLMSFVLVTCFQYPLLQIFDQFVNNCVNLKHLKLIN